ncbi:MULTISPECIES: multicopper oxidase [unclassified Oceanobacillus]|uniref:multicopper oxidase family protein n=1 Tax=unclassified Oceanobacillus TaxID=2630292 RepID=UPI001BE9438F|nr:MULTISPECIES: multicopper oxidase [unclassified Oceanobacillus]MBT2598917.1 multicopper oxidase domain-containing protein [Oceanobacillus sp. ISL-74]MBT2651836.1 multicopper oxidase domain-containing protein [Oceanobacillus sp. ISL-73]
MKLTKFVDKLPIISTLEPTKASNRLTYYEVVMKECWHKLHRDLPPTRLWGYNGLFPGPTIDVFEGELVHVKWINQLPQKLILPLDTSIHHLDQMPQSRTVTHVHGSVTKPDSDGYPEAWFTREFQETGPDFSREVYEYPNNQRAATLWYHDHAMGITRLNVYAGLIGMYIIRGEEEKALQLPSGEYEIPLVICDRTLNPDGSLYYPSGPDEPIPGAPSPSIVPAYLGEAILVNGKAWPYIDVEPRKYRFRLLNASNTRTYRLSMNEELPIYQIGSDGGLLRKSIPTRQIVMEPAERIDIVIDFTEFEGKSLTINNDLGEDADPEDQTNNIMQFKVTKPLTTKDTSRIPKHLTHIPSLKQNSINTIRNLKLVGSEDQFGRPLLLLNNQLWHDPITEKPQLGDTEIWSIVNVTNFTHPIHLHLVQFQVLDRQPFDLEKYKEDGSMIYTDAPIPPAENEKSWKDTLAAPSAQVTRVIAKFEPFTGDYVWHCHILEHEDYDMMRPFTIVNKEEPGTS